MVLPLLTRIDHVGIACRSLEAAIELYQATFGLEVASLEVHEEQGVREAMMRVGSEALVAGVAAVSAPAAGLAAQAAAGLAAEVTAGAPAQGPAVVSGLGYVQLLEPLGPDTPVGKFLARRGEGLHHVGYGVTDIGQALKAIGATGVRLLDERPRHGSMGASIAFLHPADIGGVLTELVQAVTRK
jgi:methylmalonyl-CoA/ethylmalonyl-CoA epimerase